jgi:hypothetical protein
MGDSVRAPFYLAPIVNERRSERAFARIRQSPIRGFFGLNGSGKSWGMVASILPDLEAGRPCLSTVRLLDYLNPRDCELDEDTCDDWAQHTAVDHMGNFVGHKHPHPLYVPLRNWVQVLEFKRGNILLDEITGVADSNSSSSLPPAVANKLPQLRRDEVALSYTSIDFMRTNIRIREMTRTINMCSSYLPSTVYGPDGEALLWKQRKLSKIQTYDAANLKGDIGDNYSEKLAESHIQTAWHWIPSSHAGNAYSTMDQVLHVGSLGDSGRCVYCDGTRRAQECSCADYQDRKQSRTARRTADAPASRTAGRRASAPASDSVADPVLIASAPGALDHVHGSDPVNHACAVA